MFKKVRDSIWGVVEKGLGSALGVIWYLVLVVWTKVVLTAAKVVHPWQKLWTNRPRFGSLKLGKRRLLPLLGAILAILLFSGIAYAAYTRISDIASWEIEVIGPAATPTIVPISDLVKLEFYRQPTVIGVNNQDFFGFTVVTSYPSVGMTVPGAIKIDMYPKDHSKAVDTHMVELEISGEELTTQKVQASFDYLTAVTPIYTWVKDGVYSYEVYFKFLAGTPPGTWVIKVFAVMES